MINSVTMIDKSDVAKHSYDDFKLFVKSVVIHAPNVQLHKIEVEGRDGSIDITEELMGNVRYNDRKIDLDFRFADDEKNRTLMLVRLQNFMYGKKIKFIFADDDGYFYIGRMTSLTPNVDGAVFDLTTELEVDPYKYRTIASNEEWLWDPFDFEEGVANETGGIVVDGEETVIMATDEKWDSPIIETDAPMTVSYDGGTPINLTIGRRKVYEIMMTTGKHYFTFVGNGTVSIIYRGARL